MFLNINYGFILKCYFESEKIYTIFFKKIVWSYAKSEYWEQTPPLQEIQ